MAPCFVLEVQRFKISSEVWKNSKSRRIVAFTEGLYKNKVVKSTDSKVYNGSKYVLPWNESLQKVQVNFFFIDDLLTVDIGTALYILSDDGKFYTNGTPSDVMLKIYPMGSTVPVGRVMVTVSVQPMFDDEQPIHKEPNKRQLDHNFAVPGFRFKRLSRVLHWERIRSLNLSQTVQNSDVHTLLACVDDVTTGDVSQEDIDPQLYKALQIAQYSSQYLLSSRKVMKEKEAVLKMALKTFQEEEELLDLKLAKLRARDKALRREARDLDDLTVEYSSALREVNPKLVNRLYKTYQDKLRQPSPDELARLANEDLRNWEADDRSSWSPRGEEPRRRGGGQLRHRDDRSPDWSTDDQRRDYEGGSLEAKESWRTGRVVDLSTQRHRGEERTVLTAVERPGGGEKADQYGWSRGSTSSHHQQTTAASTMPNSSMAAWASVRDTREASRENVGNGKSSASDVLRPPEEKSSHLQQAGWKSTVEVSHKPGATAVPSRYGRRDENVAALLGDASTEDSDYDSAVERRRIEISGAKLQRLASKSEFVKQSSPPAQPMIRTLSMRPVAVSSDAAANIDSGKHAAARASVPSPPPSVPERSVPGPVDVVVVAGSTPPLRKPTVSSSVDVSDNTWSATTQTLKAAIPPVLQSTDMSTKTVMSVDSLTLPDIRQEGPAPASYQRAPRSSIDDLTNNSESYEAVDLSSFIQAARQYDTNRSFGSGSYGNDIGISERVISAESHHSTTREAIERQQSDDPDASLMVEEFDDSVHMDHHPVGHAQATVARVAHSTPSASTSTPGAAATPTPAHSQASLPPLSASKYTPKRDYTFQDHQEREQSSSVEYSVEGDSPFPNLSGGAKDYNRVMRQNNSHISSNNSSSRNLSNLQQSTNNSNLLNQSGAVSQNSNTSASYEFDTFEDEDDPFARGPGPRKTIEFSNISGASSDVDASKSILIDFMLPSESKDPNRGGGGCGAESKNFQPQQQYPQRDQSYDETDASGDIGMFSPLARPRSNGHLGRADDDEDDVLMGTTKISFGNTAGGGSHNFTRTGTGTGSGLGSHNNPTGQFEKDSLGGTGYSSHHDSRKASNFSPQFGSGGGGVERDQDTEEEDSIPPPTYDSIIGGTGGTGGTEESYNNLRASQASQSEDVSSYFDSSAAVDADASAPHIHAVESAVSALKGPAWQLGRAQVDAVELARALDVFVSAVRLDAQHARIYSEIQIKVEFLGVMSELSGVVDIGRTESVQPVSFSAHLIFTPEQEALLEEEISQQDDAICCFVHVVDAITQEIVGSASVELWVMIEDAVNILRQEVEVLNLDMSHDMGSAVVDVKGFRLLKKCATALRSRRNVG